MKLYPCHCAASGCTDYDCKCVVRHRVNNNTSNKERSSTRLLRDRVEIAAEYWCEPENLENHWAAKWGTARVVRFLQMVTGAVPDAPKCRGKQLVKMAINSQLSEENKTGGGEKELKSLIPLTMHRRKVVRLLMQRVSPDYEFLLKDTPRDELPSHVPRGNKPTTPSRRFCSHPDSPRNRNNNHVPRREEEYHCEAPEVGSHREFVDNINSIKPYPVFGISGPKFLFPRKLHKLAVTLSTADFLLDAESADNQKSRSPEQLSRDMCCLQPGVEVHCVPRFRHTGVQLNPPRQSFKWLREQHSVSFDVEWNGDSDHKDLTSAFVAEDADGVVELWVGPILIGSQSIEMKYGDEDAPRHHHETDVGSNPNWELYGQVFHSVLLAYSPRDTNLKFAIGKAESSLKGCVSMLHIHQQGDDLNYFVSNKYNHDVKNIQLCLSEYTQTCSQFLKSAELLVDGFKSGSLPPLTAMYWSHPKPDLHGHPVLSKILTKFEVMVFYNAWLVDIPLLLSESGFRNMDLDDYARQLVPGVTVAYRDMNTGKWERGRIASGGSAEHNQFNIVTDTTGELLKGVTKEHIRILGVDTAVPGANLTEDADRDHDNSKKKKDSILNQLQAGDFIYARSFQRKEYMPGIVVDVHEDKRTVDVAFENGEAAAHVDIRLVRLPPSTMANRPKFKRKQRQNKAENSAFRSANTGKYTHGTLVQVSFGKDGQRVLGRIRQATDYGLKYDVMLCNGDLLEGVPVHTIFSSTGRNDSVSSLSLDNENGDASSAKKTGRSYVDAMCDRFKQILMRAAKMRPDGRDLRLQFESLDLNGNGVLCAAEFSIALRGLGFRPSEFEILEFMDRLGEKGNGVIDYGEFVRFALPMGVLSRERSLKKGLAYYENALQSVGVLSEMENAIGNNLGKIWQSFVDRDVGNTGHLSENEFVQCLLHLNISLSAEQRVQIMQSFGYDGQIDFREFASVCELLLAQAMERRTTNTAKALTRHKNLLIPGDLTEENSKDHIGKSSLRESELVTEEEKAKAKALSEKQRKLHSEHKAARRIQAILRRRVAAKKLSLRRREKSRADRQLSVMASKDKTQTSSWWIVSEGGKKKYTGSDDKEDDTFASSEQGCKVIEKWRKLLKLNTKGGLQVTGTFRAMDTNCDGLLSVEELESSLARHGVETKYTNMIFREMDCDNDGCIDMTDFTLFINGGRNTFSNDSSTFMSTMSGPQLVISELGKDLCEKLRRYYQVLERCGTDLLDLLLYRPRSLTVCSVLKKQGFVLSKPDWKRLGIQLINLIDHRGDRKVCEDLVSMMSCSSKVFEEQEYQHETKHIKEYLERNGSNKDATMQQRKGGRPLNQELLGALGRSCHKIVQGVKSICKDSGRRKEKHGALWWLLLCLHDVEKKVKFDRVDVEIILAKLKVRIAAKEIEQIFSVLDERGLGFIDCREFAKLLGLNRKVQEYLHTDYTPSRFHKAYILHQRTKLEVTDDYTAQPTTKKSPERRNGMAVYSKWLTQNLGSSCFRRLKAGLVAAEKRGNHLCDGTWLTERYRAKLGYLSVPSFERALHELGLSLSNQEISNIGRILTLGGSAERVDLFEFADMCMVINTGRYEGQGSLNDDTAGEPTKQQKIEDYLRSVLQQYIKTPRGHKNILKVFRRFDVEQNGKIDALELETVFKRLGVDLTRVNVSTLLDKFDVNGDGELDYIEFLDAIGVRSFQKKQDPKAETASSGSYGNKLDEKALMSKLVGQAHRLKLTNEDISDACGKITSSGLVSRRDLLQVLTCLGLCQTVSDSELTKLQRFTVSQLTTMLKEVVRRRKSEMFNLGGTSKTSSRGAGPAAGIVVASNMSGIVNLNTAVVCLKEPNSNTRGTIVRVPKSTSNSQLYDIRLAHGLIVCNVQRTQFRVIQDGRPAFAERSVIIDKHNQEKGIVVKTSMGPTVDVRMGNKLIRNAPISKFYMYQGSKDIYKPGKTCEVIINGNEGLYFPAKIMSCNGDSNTYAVTFDHGEKHYKVPFANLRPTCSR